MISICIPVYNYNVLPLVEALCAIRDKQALDVEIIVADDGSDQEARKQNKVISDWEGVFYFEKEENVGRSAIRNYLASKSTKEYILFIDADSEMASENFILNYINALNEGKVICGGTAYGAKPTDKDFILRYVYGINREVRSVEERRSNPYRSFSANNFCIERALFLRHQFDEQIKSYGHEDTLLGLALKKEGITIHHIDNPLVHIGLEPAMDFIEKTNFGLENLILILNNRPELNEMTEEVKVLNYFFVLKKWKVIGLFSFLFSVFQKGLLKNLTGLQPSLFYFDLYKLGYLCSRAKDLEQ